VDNITDWAVAQFLAFYSSPSGGGGGEADGGAAAAGGGMAGLGANASAQNAPASPARPSTTASRRSPSPSKLGEELRITKDAIFAYCYAVLHDPAYREKYALNLKREFPRIPFYPDFAQWVAWGETLLKLHIGYEDVKPFKLTRVDTPAPKRAAIPRSAPSSTPTASPIIKRSASPSSPKS
jgi:Type ISP C-terminal specificity domain